MYLESEIPKKLDDYVSSPEVYVEPFTWKSRVGLVFALGFLIFTNLIIILILIFLSLSGYPTSDFLIFSISFIIIIPIFQIPFIMIIKHLIDEIKYFKNGTITYFDQRNTKFKISYHEFKNRFLIHFPDAQKIMTNNITSRFFKKYYFKIDDENVKIGLGKFSSIHVILLSQEGDGYINESKIFLEEVIKYLNEGRFS